MCLHCLDGGGLDLLLDGTPDGAFVAQLAGELGWGVHRGGDLRAARLTEPLALLWIHHALGSGGAALP